MPGRVGVLVGAGMIVNIETADGAGAAAVAAKRALRAIGTQRSITDLFPSPTLQ
jgi:hypothetical protein